MVKQRKRKGGRTGRGEPGESIRVGKGGKERRRTSCEPKHFASHCSYRFENPTFISEEERKEKNREEERPNQQSQKRVERSRRTCIRRE